MSVSLFWSSVRVKPFFVNPLVCILRMQAYFVLELRSTVVDINNVNYCGAKLQDKAARGTRAQHVDIPHPLT